MEVITVKANIHAPIIKVWQCWTNPIHIVNWNFAAPDWHCPKAENNLTIGGEFHYIMAAKDGSFSFDFWGRYEHIQEAELLKIVLGDGRKMVVEFEAVGDETHIAETFEPESENPIDMQQGGWQAILNNFKSYVES